MDYVMEDENKDFKERSIYFVESDSSDGLSSDDEDLSKFPLKEVI